MVPFEEDTPLELISAIRPDILVKGADYEGKVVVGSDIAKEVRLVQFVEEKVQAILLVRHNSNDGNDIQRDQCSQRSG